MCNERKIKMNKNLFAMSSEIKWKILNFLRRLIHNRSSVQIKFTVNLMKN